MKKFSLLLLVVPFFCFGQSVSKTTKHLEDTGEKTKYDTVFGEDADYTIFPPYFINNGDGTVTDTVTGLMWAQTDGPAVSIQNAIYYCDTLRLAGYSDWRLPTGQESYGILNLQFVNPALDTTVFKKDSAQYWWTIDRQTNDTTVIWVTNAGGGIGNHRETEARGGGGTKIIQPRAVRNVTPPPTIPAHFTDNGNGTITDNLTKLIWQKVPYSDTLSWENALRYADSLTLAGYTDWRLPNVKEIESIEDLTKNNPSVDTTYFKMKVAHYWSSTTLPNLTTKAWYLYTLWGITTYDPKTFQDYVLCVRGNPMITSSVNSISSKKLNPHVYPNPFNANTTIEYTASTIQSGSLKVFNALNQMVYEKSISSRPGINKILLDGTNMPSGVYYYSLTFSSNEVPGSGKLVVVH